MFRLFEQNRLGSYDPILLGTLCNIDAVTLHPEYQRFMRLGMAAFVGPPGDEHKRFVEAQKSTEDKVLALSLFTLFAHENRHFWDAITTCSGLRLAYTALELQYEFITNFKRLMSETALYFPFSEWVRDHAKLDRLLPALITVSPEAAGFAAKAEHFLQEHEQWELGGLAPGASPSSTQIIEALAVLAQGAAIRSYFGDDAHSLFFDVLHTGETGRWYLGAIDHLRSRLPELDTDGQALLLEMSLYGSFDLPKQQGSPAAILSYLIEKFEQARPNFPPSFVPLFVLCDGYLSLLQGFGPGIAYRNAGRALIARLNELGTAFNKAGEQGLADERTGALLQDLGSAIAGMVKLTASFLPKLLFSNQVGNWRISNQMGGLYHVPRSAPFFEASYGTLLGSPLAPLVQPIVGAKVEAGWRSVPQLATDELDGLLRSFPDSEPVDLLYIFAPKGNDIPDHIRLSWKLFPTLFLCRMAITGVPETDSLASVLLSQYLSGLGPRMYAEGRCLAPLEEATWKSQSSQAPAVALMEQSADHRADQARAPLAEIKTPERNWKVKRDGVSWSCSLTPEGIIVLTGQSGEGQLFLMTYMADRDEFLGGKLQQRILELMGQKVLDEIVRAVSDMHEAAVDESEVPDPLDEEAT